MPKFDIIKYQVVANLMGEEWDRVLICISLITIKVVLGNTTHTIKQDSELKMGNTKRYKHMEHIILLKNAQMFIFSLISWYRNQVSPFSKEPPHISHIHNAHLRIPILVS